MMPSRYALSFIRQERDSGVKSCKQELVSQMTIAMEQAFLRRGSVHGHTKTRLRKEEMNHEP